MSYPKYTRTQDRRCKLTDKDLMTIKDLHNKGYTNVMIANRLNVSAQAIRLYVNPEARKYDSLRMKKRYYTNSPSKDKLRRTSKLYRKRKRILQTKEIREYYKGKTMLWRKRGAL